MIRKKRWFSVVYMFIVTAFFSTIVIGFTEFTRQRVDANQRLAFEKAVLNAVLESSLSTGDIHEQFESLFEAPSEETGGAYLYREDGEIAAYALPISGKGFWAPIRGVIGIKSDKQTVVGIAFYEQNETPGLGAEIAKPDFTNQFIGKKLSSEGKMLNIKRPGDELGESDVHAVTGATQTSVRLEKIINTAIEDWKKQIDEKVK
ncbi:MAG: FMN-binding protein [Planctomycetota bacterium]|jgi:Na+-transporting NADH:ubiquinone oxidoreductase subunit C